MSKQIKIFQFSPNTHLARMEETINHWLTEKGESIAIVHSQTSETREQFIFSCVYQAKAPEKQKINPKQVKLFRSQQDDEQHELENFINEWFAGYGDEIEVNRCLQSTAGKHLTMLIFFRSARNKIS